MSAHGCGGFSVNNRAVDASRRKAPSAPPRLTCFHQLFIHFASLTAPLSPAPSLQGWRCGLLRRWDLVFPVLTVFDRPGQTVPGEGFHEWPLFDIFKVQGGVVLVCA